MRLFSIPPPTLLAGFLAVLIGYASSAAIIWQAAIVAGATTAQISGWMTALGLAMGVSTLTLTLWYRVPVLTAWSTPGAALLVTGLLALFFSPFGVYSVGIAAITAAICQSPEAHPDKDQRWLAAAVAGIFYLIAGLFGSAITGMMAALPVSWIQMLAGLALLSTIGGSLYQALHNERERDAAVVAFLVTASGLTLFGIGSAFWGLIAGGVCYVVLNLIANRNR
ncbi:TPA: benzoate/H(+) symporter BenE family transporter [Escherichia coli]|uniref:benzoate/H(+) symporter BenE family transporter n=1 Tax=Escherichia coli TaxID=562 RepID=UPI000D7844A1|nr:benzoate/H(+) symporter BenE family transporter [Escherichia coli]MDM6782225.1 benzoate/H(+) symporter BenE family transporter [Escherichia coli]HBB0548997.1 benzoate/H(+) symporter BenE family transporter [Escherichia coli]HDS3263950.1 benzoate/H(+) symporter BenE family transporter [Escherichia coli]HDS5046151.1 benzoate/H(+) symporter BenE family transporter [Escherichia coli]HDS6100395.1 benzoate/H(+) symporter BenE family transporter [Escherichia coli]